MVRITVKKGESLQKTKIGELRLTFSLGGGLRDRRMLIRLYDLIEIIKKVKKEEERGGTSVSTSLRRRNMLGSG